MFIGLMQTYGHISHCAWNVDWDAYDDDKKSEIKSYQGVRYAQKKWHFQLEIPLKYLETVRRWAK